MKSIQRKQGGFSLVEILLVLGIIAILAIAAFIIFPQVQAANRANTEQSNITTIAAGVKNLYGATRNYNGISASTLIKAKIAPSSMYANDSTATALTSSWSAPVAIAASTPTGGTGTANSQFTLTYSDVPSEVCTRLVPGLLANFSSVTVGGTNVSANNPAGVVDACSASTTATVAFISN